MVGARDGLTICPVHARMDASGDVSGTTMRCYAMQCDVRPCSSDDRLCRLTAFPVIAPPIGSPHGSFPDTVPSYRVSYRRSDASGIGR